MKHVTRVGEVHYFYLCVYTLQIYYDIYYVMND